LGSLPITVWLSAMALALLASGVAYLIYYWLRQRCIRRRYRW